MAQQWKHIKLIENEFPEVYSTETKNKAFIEIKANLLKGIVKINIVSPRKEYYQSIISNGVVIEEKDLKLKKSAHLEDFFKEYHIEISSLPNNKILQLIGGNYGILTYFLGSSKKKARLKKPRTFLKKLPSILNNTALSFKVIFRRPSASDVVEMTLIGCIGVGIYFHSFDYLLSGAFTSALSILSGFSDWLLRGKNPSMIKILPGFALGLFGIYTGFLYQ